MNSDKLNSNDTCSKLTITNLIVGLFYIYSNIFLFNPLIALFAISMFLTYNVFNLIWDKSKKILSAFLISVFFVIIVIIFVDLTHFQSLQSHITTQRCTNSNILKSDSDSFQSYIQLNYVPPNDTIQNKEFNIIFIETSSNKNYIDFKESCALGSCFFIR